jgi:hypothetical protein
VVKNDVTHFGLKEYTSKEELNKEVFMDKGYFGKPNRDFSLTQISFLQGSRYTAPPSELHQAVEQ